jgi:hypothetical protein
MKYGPAQEVLSDTMTEDGAKLLNVEQTADWNYNHRLHKKDPPNNRVSNETKTQLADNVCANLVADYGAIRIRSFLTMYLMLLVIGCRRGRCPMSTPPGHPSVMLHHITLRTPHPLMLPYGRRSSL